MKDELPEGELGWRTRRGFLVGLGAVGAGYAGWRWLMQAAEEGGIPYPFRRVLAFNEKLSEKLFDPQRLIREESTSALTAGGPRVNGDIGLTTEIDLAAWRLGIVGTDLALTLQDLKKLPEFTQNTPLRCIEGWTTVGRWTGVRLADFTDRFFPEGRSKHYVALATPDKDYFVGLDAPSAFHPQTLLCYAIDGQPISQDHGAPLRLLIPTKYGIKNLKRIGTIYYTDERPPDYWAEEGYDWYAGL